MFIDFPDFEARKFKNKVKNFKVLLSLIEHFNLAIKSHFQF